MLFAKYKAVVCSYIGGRDAQEDNFYVSPSLYLTPEMRNLQELDKEPQIFTEKLGKKMIAAVFDGMGGYSGGSAASLLAAQYFDKYGSLLTDAADLSEQSIVNFVDALNQHFREKAKEHPDFKNMGSTLCGIIVHPDESYCVHVGDSVLYCYENQQLVRLTKAQNLTRMMSDAGMNADETMIGGRSLYNYIGVNANAIAEVFPLDAISRSTILILASDGFAEAVSNEEIIEILSTEDDLEEKGQKLMEAADRCMEGFGDNRTIILISTV